jgi:hypothetical protein
VSPHPKTPSPSVRALVALLAVMALLTAAVSTAGCGERMVKVQTGEKVVCTYGETVSSTVKTIEVPASKVDAYKVVVRPVLCSRHRAIETLYAAAQRLITAGNLKLAVDKLALVLELDANYRKAAQQKKDIDAGKTPAVDPGTGPDGGTGGTGSNDTTGGTGVPETPVASLATWVPSAIAGYTAQPVIADAGALTREYVPTPAGSVKSVVVVAQQLYSEAQAKSFATGTIRSGYPSNRSTITIGARTADFGTRGRYAAVAWNQGAITVVVEVYGTGGVASLKTAVQAVGAAIAK